MTKPVLLAGLLGGLLGAVGSFVLARSFPTTAKPVAAVEVPRSEARDRADDLVAKLRAGQEDDFFNTVRSASVKQLKDEDFKQYREYITELREGFATRLGAPGDIEFSRETVLSPSLVRVVYIAKHAFGSVALFVVFYNTADGWRLLGLTYVLLEDALKELH